MTELRNQTLRDALRRYKELPRTSADRKRQIDDYVFGNSTLRGIEQNPVLGGLAAASTGAADALSNVEVGFRGNSIGLGEISPFRGAGEVLEDASFGFGPVESAGQNVRLDPRVADVADVTPTGMVRRAAATAASAALPAMARRAATSPGDDFDPRFLNSVRESNPRVGLRDRVANMEIGTEGRAVVPQRLGLAQFEGQPFVTSMSDRTAAGDVLVDINGVPLAQEVDRAGGQDFMFHNPGQVWASARNPVSNIMNVAERVKAETGIDPLFIPWRMAPTGSDFSTMTGETMLTYASANMGKGVKRSVNARMKKLIPGWVGLDNPESLGQFRATTGDTRKAVLDMLDKGFRDKGGLSVSEARAAVTDPIQFNAREGGIQNIGRIEVERGVSNSTHPSYPFAVPGEGLGAVTEDVGVMELLPDIVEKRGVPDPLNPRATDIRSMQGGAKSGIITPEILQKLEDRGIKTSALPLAVIISSAAAYGLLGTEEAQASE